MHLGDNFHLALPHIQLSLYFLEKVLCVHRVLALILPLIPVAAIHPHEIVHKDNIPAMAEHGVAVHFLHELHHLVSSNLD